MVRPLCSSSLLPLNLYPFLPTCLYFSPSPLLALTLRCLPRHLGLACHPFLESDLSEFDEVELELNSSPLTSQNHSFAIINRVRYPPLESKTGDSSNWKYSFDKKWFGKKDMMKRIISALSKQGWDLSFDTYDNIGLDYWSCARMLHDLFNETSDSAVVYYLFRKWGRWDDILEQKLPMQCTMIHIAVSGNMNHIAKKLLHEMIRNFGTDIEGHNLVFDTLWQTRRDQAEMETVFSMLVLCVAKEGMLDVAARLIKVMENFGFHPSHGVYVSISFTLKSEFYKKPDSTWQVFEEMQSWGAKLIELTLNLLIQDFCASCLDSACKLLHDMPTFGCNANIVTYTMVIDAFCREGFLKEATSLLFKMIRMGISLDSTSVAAVIDGYCKRGSLELAENLMKFSPCVPDAFVYNSFIFKWCQSGEIEKAHELLYRMSEFGIVPDSVNYTTILKGYCRLRHLNMALMTFAQMLKRGIQPTVISYTVLIEGLCKNDDIQGAEFVFDALKRDGLQPDIVTYNTLIDGYSKKGYMHKAYEQMDLMKKSGIPPDSATYNIIMHGLVKRGFSVESVFFELVKRGYSPDEIYSPDQIAYTNIIHGYSKEGRLEEAYLIWCNISKNGMTPDVITCSALLYGYCKMRRMGDADVLFHKMLDAGLEPDLILFNTLIRGFCSVKDASKAYQLLIMMKDKGICPDSSTHSALVVGFEREGFVNAKERAAMILQGIFS